MRSPTWGACDPSIRNHSSPPGVDWLVSTGDMGSGIGKSSPPVHSPVWTAISVGAIVGVLLAFVRFAAVHRRETPGQVGPSYTPPATSRPRLSRSPGTRPPPVG